ncbi:MAG: methyltransferase domain-containing protein [Chloroflexi bacterium]|nr:methyltransferase domain-containing protein [Chloroflexota bacterium]
MSVSRRPRTANRDPRRAQVTEVFIAEFVSGLAEYVEDELRQTFARDIAVLERHDDEIRFSAPRSPGLNRLACVQAVYSVQEYPIPRPKALLGDQHFRRLQQQILGTIQSYPVGTFKTLHLAAAGSDSSIMSRLKQSLSDQVGLAVDDAAGDVLLRIRRSRSTDGWESLVRLTPRPSATRDWRVCDMPGALNGSVARVISQIASPQAGTLCNLTSGSGSIAIEHALRQPANRSICVELDANVIACALQNAKQAKIAGRILMVQCDAAQTPFPTGAFDTLCADLPFGQRIGSHQLNAEAYPLILVEAARIASIGARFVVLSHEVRLMETLLQDSSTWKTDEALRITLRGLHPRLYVLRRR